MAMRNAVPPHLVKRPCAKCSQPTPALQNGVMLRSPTCPKCRAEYAKQFAQARVQRIKNERRAA